MWKEVVQLLLLLAGTGKGIAEGQCSSGFLTPDQLTDRLTGNVVHRNQFGRLWLFPDMTFSCEGAVSKWIIGAEWVDGGTRYPEMQIWRLIDPPISSEDTYEVIERVELRITEESPNGMYEYTVDPPMPFRAGDVVGVFEPSSGESRIQLYFKEGQGPTIYYVFSNQPFTSSQFSPAVVFNEIASPLIAVEIASSSPVTTGQAGPEGTATSQEVEPTVTSGVETPTVRRPATTLQITSSLTTRANELDGSTISMMVQLTSTTESTSASTLTPAVPSLSDTTESTPVQGTTQSFSVSSSQSAQSPQPPPSAERGTGSSSTGGLIAGIVVTIMVMIIIATGMIIVGFALVLNKRRKRSELVLSVGHTVSPLDNPVYSPGDVSKRSCKVPSLEVEDTITGLPHEYEMPPSNSLALDLTSSVANGVYQDVEGSGNVYELMDSEEGREFYRVYGNTDTPQFKETDGIHVPTEFQRRELRSNLFASRSGAPEDYEKVYASLAETQHCSSFFEEAGVYWTPSSNSEQLYEQLATKKYREIQRSQIEIISHLGSGQFGTVTKGIWQSSRGAREVAVKMLKAGSSEEDKVRFLQEAAINGQFRHINVVRLMGVVTLDEPVMIVLEYLMNGDLRKYLIKQRPPTGETVPSNVPGLLLSFCRQIAAGMAYLSQKGFVHRDLAARNVLVGEDKTCKISDFGMSKDLEDESYYVAHGGKVPVKWTAPEAILFKKYTTASDVWSYGVLVYEIWSLGHKPFEAYTNAEAVELVNGKKRLPPPPGCPRAIYEIMIMCWHPDHQLRPTFQLLSEDLSEPESELLARAEDEVRTHPLAATLGAALEAGENLYSDLQRKYLP